MTQLQAVLWDMDGTLIDSEPLWMDAQVRLIEEHGGTWTHADALHLIGSSSAFTVAAMQGAGVTLDPGQIVGRLTDEVTAGLARDVQWRPGAVELVTALAAAGVPQAIVTTSPRRMATIVADALPEGAIARVVSGDDVERSKPSPEPYLQGAALLDVDVTACVAIEDSPYGLAAAVAAGTAAIGVESQVPLVDADAWTRLDSLEGVTVEQLQQIVASRG